MGCLYAHLHQWQKAKERGNDNTIILESDAVWNLGVPAYSFQDIVDHAPKDYDIIFLNYAGARGGKYIYSYKSHGPEVWRCNEA